MAVKNKQNSSVNFLVRAEFLTARPPDRPPLVITIPHSHQYPTALMRGNKRTEVLYHPRHKLG